MTYSLSRLKLYSMLSAIEEDLRVAISLHLSPQHAPQKLLGTELFSKTKSRLDREPDYCGDIPTLERLLEFSDFAELYELLNRNRQTLPSQVSDHIRAVTPLLAKLVPIRNRIAHTRPLAPDDLTETRDISERLVKSSDSIWINLKERLNLLRTNPSFVLGLEIPILEESVATLRPRLPPPDFDETGFIGRDDIVNDLQRLITKGAHPIITILGEGGMGKTALALKVAYDIADSTSNPFDAIVWTSSKTSQLTGHEIVRIENAISDSVGVFRNVATELAGSETIEPIEEILSYLEEFRILLILDNLETVLDDRIQSFLGRLPFGSKVLITSRIGLGALENRVKLLPMKPGEAVSLLRAVSKARNVQDLTKTSNDKLAAYCDRMRNNPGYIKWFVSAVSVGKRPEEVLANPEVFLDFCMSNVYDHLSEPSRFVLWSIVCIPGQKSQAELGFLNELDVEILQPALQELLSTSMVTLVSVPTGSSFESRYELSSLARDYLAKHHPPSAELFQKFTKLRNQLTTAREEIEAVQRRSPYSAYSIATRSQSDFIVAKYLVEALTQAKKKKYSLANESLHRAKQLAPEYFEVHRVEAWVAADQGNISLALSAYEAAVELEPKSPQVRALYAGFLLRSLDDPERALEQILIARKLDPDAISLQIEMIRCCLYLRRFDDAEPPLSQLLTRAGELSERHRQILYDLGVQYHQRLADYLVLCQEYAKAVTALEDLQKHYTECPRKFLDSKMRERLRKTLPTAEACAYRLRRTSDQSDLRGRAEEFLTWLHAELAITTIAIHDLVEGEVYLGTVLDLPVRENYGYILIDRGPTIFFHKTALTDSEEWSSLCIGDRVALELGVRNESPVAVSVMPEEGRSLEAANYIGEIVNLPTSQPYGFVRADVGPRFFFHRSAFADQAQWGDCEVGTRVRFSIGFGPDGRRVAQHIELLSDYT